MRFFEFGGPIGFARQAAATPHNSNERCFLRFGRMPRTRCEIVGMRASKLEIDEGLARRGSQHQGDVEQSGRAESERRGRNEFGKTPNGEAVSLEQSAQSMAKANGRDRQP